MKIITAKEFRTMVKDAMIVACIDLQDSTHVQQDGFPQKSRWLFAYPKFEAKSRIEDGYIYFPKSQNKTIEIKDGVYVQLKDKTGKVYEFSFLAPIVF